MIAELRVIAGKAQHGIDAMGISADDIGLHGQPVTVPGDHLQDRVKPICRRITAAAKLDMRTMAVWLSVTLTASTYPLNSSAF